MKVETNLMLKIYNVLVANAVLLSAIPREYDVSSASDLTDETIGEVEELIQEQMEKGE